MQTANVAAVTRESLGEKEPSELNLCIQINNDNNKKKKNNKQFKIKVVLKLIGRVSFFCRGFCSNSTTWKK